MPRKKFNCKYCDKVVDCRHNMDKCKKMFKRLQLNSKKHFTEIEKREWSIEMLMAERNKMIGLKNKHGGNVYHGVAGSFAAIDKMARNITYLSYWYTFCKKEDGSHKHLHFMCVGEQNMRYGVTEKSGSRFFVMKSPPQMINAMLYIVNVATQKRNHKHYKQFCTNPITNGRDYYKIKSQLLEIDAEYRKFVYLKQKDSIIRMCKLYAKDTKSLKGYRIMMVARWYVIQNKYDVTKSLDAWKKVEDTKWWIPIHEMKMKFETYNQSDSDSDMELDF